MAFLKSKSGNRLFVRSLAVAGSLIIILVALHFWFVQNAGTILKKYISEESHGKIKLELSQLDLNFWSNRLQIHEAQLTSTDSLHEPITYYVTFSRVSVRVGSVWKLLFQKKLLLDSLHVYNPVIRVIKWRKDTAQVIVKDELSLPQEMGKVYNSLLNALNKFAVRRIIVDNAAISLINKMKPHAEPVTVSKIYFDLDRVPVMTGNEITYLNKEQIIELKTSHQNISLPGGRHYLSFKTFNLHLLRQRIELDSCTVTALPTGSLKSSYRIFFKKLSLTGVDFSALSGENLIKADSVFCENPFFDLNLYRADAVQKKTQIPDPNKIIRELTGNLNLAFVVVKNAGIHFDIYGRTKRSFFNSNKDNFEIQAFRLNPDSLEPVSVGRFDMTLRDYHLYNEDSSSSFGFDSLHFLNKRIALNNFTILSSSSRNKLRNEFDIKVPHFELSQLDWYQLIFEQNITAKQAILNNPVINFTRKKSDTPGKKLDLFAALQNLDSMLALENVTVINGQVNGRLGSASSFNVQNIDFNIYSNKLLRSTNKEGVRSAVEHLSFSKGELRLKDITARLEHASFTGNNLIYADKVAISSEGRKITATVNKVFIDNMQLDDNADNIEVDGLSWKSARVDLKAFPYEKNGKVGSSIHLKNIAGNNTELNFFNGPTMVSTYVETLNASSLLKKGNDPIRVEDFVMTGKDLAINSNAVRISADSYKFSGTDSSSLTGVRVGEINGRDTLNIRSSYVSFSTDLNDLFANEQHLSYVHAAAPVIEIIKWDSVTATPGFPAAQSPILIDDLTATEPDITVSTHHNDSVAIVNIPWSDNSMVHAYGIVISGSGMQIGSLLVNTTAATFTRPTGEVLGVEHGKIDLQLSDVRFGKQGGKMKWSGFINNLSLQNANGFQLGKAKNNLRFQQASLGNLNLSSGILPDFNQLLKANGSAWLRIPKGEFIDSNRTLEWYNVNYINSTRTLSLDSFIYHPKQTLDSVVAKAPYQLDYITVKTGAVTVSGLDATRYEKDSSFIASTVQIDNPVLTVYRDKRPPYSPNRKLKPLPVNMIRSISLPVSVQNIQLVEGTITYSEKNKKSGQQGDLLFTHVNGTVENIKNSGLLDDDSLSLKLRGSLMDAADISLSLKESYTDSLSGFLLTAKIKSADLSILNPFLVPFSNIKITSGKLDSLSLRAVGRKDIAWGEMNLHYRNLRLHFVKDGDPHESTFLGNVLGFLANTLVVRSNNSSRTGVIYSRRYEDRSFVNYIVRISLSGIMSTIGIKSNRKYEKRYKKQLRLSNMPPVS